ncbi:MAG: hypothetical protein PHO85_02985 [Candidatus Cloacimonetes bacterium]|jgi:signal transduction histidine kinase|nr:hypothetical protein [Candidatus Cloacimonadota bacterium]MDD2506216.1 hypothetical protein [Candidatus Cloacimonadota bacterium]MDD4147468.1 hypothetical protein [Candidatus Cloacimonadota bacterium]MDD4559617.1 hypothetical protein [Candidatus Cloacimonadota bacterium]
MIDNILVRHILEGLIHNLNNPLNLILAYSHRLRKEYPDIEEISKIYEAGVRMDDMLKDLYNQLTERSFAKKQEISLPKWLDKEMGYLQHYLPVKHSFRLNQDKSLKECKAHTSSIELSMWFETVLLRLSLWFDSIELRTGAMEYEGCCAIYLAFNDDFKLDDVQWDKLLQQPESTLFEEDSFCINSVWLPQQNRLLGVIR